MLPHAPILHDLPRPANRAIALRVTPAGQRALQAGHPWVFESAVQRQSHRGQPGDTAVIFDRKGRFLAVGLYDPLSAIRVRVLAHGKPAAIDEAWLSARISSAVSLRALLPSTGTTGYRLVHGENDGLPGLVIDRYHDTAVVQLHTFAWMPRLHQILNVLEVTLPLQHIVLRLSRALRPEAEYLHGLADGHILAGSEIAGPVHFEENHLRFQVDPQRGQKTGFFLDQRENRAQVEALAKDKQVLNVFAYSGGFSLYAARGGARSVLSVDLSRPALRAAQANFALNSDHPRVAAAQHEIWAIDAFQGLDQLARAGRRFDLVIIDPPAFAHRKDQASRALASYGKLTELGLAVLQDEGILMQASCSSRVPPAAFFAAVHEAAGRRSRPLTEIQRTGHPIDHPVGFAEGAYLKCLFARAAG